MAGGSSGAGRGGPGREPGAAFSIGRYLASQRRLRGISLDELAERTRIPRRNLERLESGAFDAKPDGFVRGFVRTVAESLGLDPQDAVMRLAAEPSAADEGALRARQRRLVLVALILAGAVLALGVAGARLALHWMTESDAGAGETWVYRRNAVRALAEQEAERGAAAPEASAEPKAGAAARPSEASGREAARSEPKASEVEATSGREAARSEPKASEVEATSGREAARSEP